MTKYWLGKKRSKDTIEKIRISCRGRIPWNKGMTGLKIGFAVIPQPEKHWALGKNKLTHPSIKRVSEHHKDSGNPIWRGGISQSYLGRKAKEYGLRTGVCSYCKKKNKTCVHHKDRDRRNNSKTNLVEICSSCHQNEHHIGAKRSLATKRRISISKKGKPLSAVHIQSLKKAHKNCKCPIHQ